MPRVRVQRAGNDDAVNILYVKQPPVIVKCLDIRRSVFGLLTPPGINIRDRGHLDIRNLQDLFQQFSPAPANTDHSHAHAVVRAQHSRRWHD